MITLKQYTGSHVKAVDDANLYYMLLQSSGVLSGLSVTLTGTNQLNITAGYGFASGRMFFADADSVNATLAPSGTQKGRLYIHIDLANETAPAQFLTVAASTLPALVQEDLTGSGNVFDIPLAEYTVSAVQVSGFTYVAPWCSLAGGKENLLINANFLHPVNQRGQSSYNTANKYGCDRWRLVSGSTMSIGGAGLVVTGSIVQPIEGLAEEKEQTFVLSAKQAGGGVQSISGVLASTPVQSTNGYSMSFSLSGEHVLVTLGAGTWEWAKLELGEYPSAFSPRSYEEELAHCQRYYESIPETTVGVCGGSGSFGAAAANASFIMIPFKTTKRTVPTITVGGRFGGYSTKSTDETTADMFIGYWGAGNSTPGYTTLSFTADAEIY